MSRRDWITGLGLPLWALTTAAHPRLRGDWRERWGLTVAPARPGVLWIHAASVGEVGAALALIASLETDVLLTTDTETGAALAREQLGGRGTAAVRPVDHHWTLAPLWSAARPRALVLVEDVWWPGLVGLARSQGVPVLRVSAAARGGLRRLHRLLGPRVDAVAVQDDATAAYFREQGVEDVTVLGDLKLAGAMGAPLYTYGRPAIVGASTREGDEIALIEALDELPGVLLVLAPRHPARFERVAEELTRCGVRWARRTEHRGAVPREIDVLLLDTLGELARALVGASAAFIGGTFTADIGGHSPAEAIRAGLPVVSGPETAANCTAFAAASWHRVSSRAGLGEALREALQMPAAVHHSTSAEDTARWVHERVRATPPAPSSPRPWGRGLTGPYLAVDALRRRAFELGVLRVHRVGRPVVSVGSTNPRSPGKTTCARWVANWYRDRGLRVGVALRGVGRSSRGPALRLSTVRSDAGWLGDDGALFALDGHRVASCPDRVQAAEALAPDVDVLVLDDGLQHHRLHRDLDLAVLDPCNPSARGAIPLGDRRERHLIPARVSGVIWVGHDAPKVAVNESTAEVRATLRAGAWFRGASVAGDAPVAPSVFIGTGDPGRALELLGVAYARVLTLRDHEAISDEKGSQLREWSAGSPLACTAKDWVRLPSDLADEVYWRDLKLVLDEGGEKLERLLSEAVGAAR